MAIGSLIKGALKASDELLSGAKAVSRAPTAPPPVIEDVIDLEDDLVKYTGVTPEDLLMHDNEKVQIFHEAMLGGMPADTLKAQILGDVALPDVQASAKTILDEMNEIDDIVLKHFPDTDETDLVLADPTKMSEAYEQFKSGLISEQEFAQEAKQIIGDSVKADDLSKPDSLVITDPHIAQSMVEDHLDTDQIAMLTDEEKVKVANQLIGEADDDNVSLTLAKAADRYQGDLTPLVSSPNDIAAPVAKTLLAVRGERIRNVPMNLRRRVTNALGSADAAQYYPEWNAVRQNIEDYHDQYIDAVNQMTDLDLASIEFYTYQGDQAVNWGRRLREFNQGSAADRTVQYMNEALEKLPPHQGVVYRVVGRDQWEKYQNIGSIVEEPGFSSFTTNKAGLNSLDELKTDPLFKGGPHTITLILQSKTGRYIEPLTHYPGEHEVLLKAGAKLKVVDIDPDLKQVYLEEVE